MFFGLHQIDALKIWVVAIVLFLFGSLSRVAFDRPQKPSLLPADVQLIVETAHIVGHLSFLFSLFICLNYGLMLSIFVGARTRPRTAKTIA